MKKRRSPQQIEKKESARTGHRTMQKRVSCVTKATMPARQAFERAKATNNADYR